jgi:hypothetical protein
VASTADAKITGSVIAAALMLPARSADARLVCRLLSTSQWPLLPRIRAARQPAPGLRVGHHPRGVALRRGGCLGPAGAGKRISAPGRKLAGVQTERVLAEREGSSGLRSGWQARTSTFAPKQRIPSRGELA